MNNNAYNTNCIFCLIFPVSFGVELSVEQRGVLRWTIWYLVCQTVCVLNTQCLSKHTIAAKYDLASCETHWHSGIHFFAVFLLWFLLRLLLCVKNLTVAAIATVVIVASYIMDCSHTLIYLCAVLLLTELPVFMISYKGICLPSINNFKKAWSAS